MVYRTMYDAEVNIAWSSGGLSNLQVSSTVSYVVSSRCIMHVMYHAWIMVKSDGCIMQIRNLMFYMVPWTKKKTHLFKLM